MRDLNSFESATCRPVSASNRGVGRPNFGFSLGGSLELITGLADPGTAVTTWSLGFQETEPGVWKVNRISPVSIPQGILALPGGLPPTDESQLGFSGGIGFPVERQGKWSPGSATSVLNLHRPSGTRVPTDERPHRRQAGIAPL